MRHSLNVQTGNAFSGMNQQNSVPLEIDVYSVKRMLDSGTEALLIDCREPEEHEFARIHGSVLIPMYETPDRLAEIEPHRQKRIIVHCHHGRRSMQVVQWLRQQGFEKAQSMADGIEAWSEFVDSTVPRY